MPPKRPKTREEIAAESEPPLRLGSCVLENPAVAAMVQKSLLHFHLQRYDLHAWCVMPNHVHVVYIARGEHTPKDIHHSWKSYTAHQAKGQAFQPDASHVPRSIAIQTIRICAPREEFIGTEVKHMRPRQM